MPISRFCLYRRFARSSALAVRYIFTGASFRTFVPISLPSISMSALLASSLCALTMLWRTLGHFETAEAAALTASVRILSVTSLPLSSVCCFPSWYRTSTFASLAQRSASDSFCGFSPSSIAYRPIALYIAPVSKCKIPSLEATASEIVDFPAPTGPSIAIFIGIVSPHLFFFPNLNPSEHKLQAF